MENDNQEINNADVSVQDDQEWSQALDDFSADKGISANNADDKKPEEGEAAGEVEAGEAAKKPEGEADGGKGKDTDTEAEDAPIDPNQALREQRAFQRELAEDQKVMATDVREQMFGDLQTKLVDSDGDPIESIEDVMRLENPKTKKAFTEEEAAKWLLESQQYVAKQSQEAERQIQEITEVNLSIKDQADSVKSKYGDMLAAMPELAKRVSDAYSKTLVKDEKTGIITKAPVSLEEFYDTALLPYVKYAEKLEAQNAQVPVQKSPPPQVKQAEKRQSVADRSDIVSGSQIDNQDPEDKEWAAVAKKYYEG